MRVIKFRGKRVDNGEWVYGFYYNLWNPIQGNRIPVIDESTRFDHDGDSISVYEIDPETVGQYIGINDVNGREVYTGDVFGTQIQGYSENCVVEYDECCFMLFNGKKKRPINTQEKSIHKWLPVGTESARYAPFEVIGNIHDNPIY